MNRFIKAESLPEKVIFTDDPLRVKMLAAHYLDNVEGLYVLRGMIGCIGEYRGSRIAFISCGFGESAARLHMAEAARLGTREIIYLGECVSLTRDIDLMSVIVADGGHPELLGHILKKADTIHTKVKIVETVTIDCFWCEGVAAQGEKELSIVDFAASAIYSEAKKLGVTAAVMLTVSENNVTTERITEDTRQSRFNDSSVLALEVLSQRTPI